MSAKLSQQIELEACQEESDWKAFRLHAKAYKQAKKEEFEDGILPEIKACPLVSFVTDKGNFYQIGFKDGRIFDYYPGVDRLMRHKPGKWFFGGKNLLIGMINQPENTITVHDPELPVVVIIDSVK